MGAFIGIGSLWCHRGLSYEFRLNYFPHTITPKPGKPVVETSSESCITGDIGVGVVSEYIFHGMPQENQGFILQPYADLSFKFYQGPGLVSSVTADVGIWNSFHGTRTGAIAGSTIGNWFEFDFSAGVTAEVGKFSISPSFKVYESPSDAFTNVYTMSLNVEYDDTDLLGDFAMHPHVFFERGMHGRSGNGTGNGNYSEIGVAPGQTYRPERIVFMI